VLITLMGWFLILGGLTRMSAPGLSQQQAHNTTAILVVQIALLAIGVFLSFKAYRRGGREVT
jgi:TRAP-type C4-dicarboxylate transport system permease large subunit